MKENQVLQPTVDALNKATGPSEAKETDSQPEEPGVYKFDLKAQYQDPDNPGEVIDGSSLKTRLNLGRLSSQFQGQRDKALERIQTLSQQIEAQNQLIEKYKKQEAARQAEQTTLEALKKMGYDSQQQDTGTGEPGWSAGNEETPLTRDEMLQQLHLIRQESLEAARESADAGIERKLQELFNSQQKRERAESFVSARWKAKRNQLSADMPLVDPDTIQQIVDLYQKAHTLDMLALQQADADKIDEAEAAYAQSEEVQRQANRLHAEAMNNQAELSAEEERQKGTEMFGPGSELYEEFGNLEPTYNKAESAKREKRFLDSIRKKEKALTRALSS